MSEGCEVPLAMLLEDLMEEYRDVKRKGDAKKAKDIEGEIRDVMDLLGVDGVFYYADDGEEIAITK